MRVYSAAVYLPASFDGRVADVVSAIQESIVEFGDTKNAEARLATQEAVLVAARESAACQPHEIGAEQPEFAHQASTEGAGRLVCTPPVTSEEIWA